MNQVTTIDELKIGANKEFPELFNEQILESTRIIVKCGDRYLCCHQTKQKGSKSLQTEFPWGKCFDDPDNQNTFLSFTKQEKESYIRESAVVELLEETGVFIDPLQLIYIGNESEDMDGEYSNKKGLKCTKKRAHIYFVEIPRDAYPPDDFLGTKTLEEQNDNDDNIKEVTWETQVFEKDMQEILWSNSQFSIETLSAIKSIQQKVNFTLCENKQTSLDKKEVDFSFLDIANIQLFPDYDAFIQAYAKNFKYSETSASDEQKENEIAKIKGIIEHSVFSQDSDIRKELAYIHGEKIVKKFCGTLKESAKRIKNLEQFYDYIKRYCKHPLGKSFLKEFTGYRLVHTLSYYQDMQECEKYAQFVDYFEENIYEDRVKKLVRGYDGKKIDISIDENLKTNERIASKLATKPGMTPDKLKDVFRIRIQVWERDDIKAVHKLLQQRVLNLHLQEDNPIDTTNAIASTDRSEKKLLWAYGGIPVEIQIMTFDDYKDNEAWENHHKVYSRFQNMLKHTRDHINSIPEKWFDQMIKDLSQDSDIQKSLWNTMPLKDKAANKLYDDIKARAKTYFYKTQDGSYTTYAHTLRYMGMWPLVAKQNRYFRDLTLHLNKELWTQLRVLQWYKVFCFLKDIDYRESGYGDIKNILWENVKKFYEFCWEKKMGIDREKIKPMFPTKEERK